MNHPHDRDFSEARQLLDAAVTGGVCPAAVAEVGDHRGAMWRHAAGRRSPLEEARRPASADTIFDLASLTKVIATTSLAMRQVDAGTLDLDRPLRDRLPEWRAADRDRVTTRDVLEHAAGLTAHLPLFRDHVGRLDFEATICRLPLEYRPRSRSLYSDLGFILLGFLLVDGHPDRATLDSQFAAMAAARGWGTLSFRPPRTWRPRIAPTEHDPWRGRLLVGEVHDENCHALGGVSGHAGLFGTVDAVGRFARDMLRAMSGATTVAASDTVRHFCRRSVVPGSTRALGWDTMRPSSSCGTRMSDAAVGHTGFTGTSLWLDPRADRYIVLLTNRVHPTRANQAILAFRPIFHDAVMRA